MAFRWSRKSGAAPLKSPATGTTTATVLAQSIFQEGLKAVVAGMNPMDIKRGIDKEVGTAMDELKQMSVACEDSTAIAQVARSRPMAMKRSAT